MGIPVNADSGFVEFLGRASSQLTVWEAGIRKHMQVCICVFVFMTVVDMIDAYTVDWPCDETWDKKQHRSRQLKHDVFILGVSIVWPQHSCFAYYFLQYWCFSGHKHMNTTWEVGLFQSTPSASRHLTLPSPPSPRGLNWKTTGVQREHLCCPFEPHSVLALCWLPLWDSDGPTPVKVFMCYFQMLW